MAESGIQMPSVSSVILYELNEVPWRVVDWYIGKRPESNLAKALNHSISLTSVTHDEGELHPWTTWPTFHRAAYNTSHKIRFLNQDRSCADHFPPIWEILAEAGRRVGVFGSLQSYPKPPNIPFSFYIPDTFAPGPETHPSRYEAFQRFNLRQTRNDGAVASAISFDKDVVNDLVLLKLNGLSTATCFRLAVHLLQEKKSPLYRTRRPALQALVAFDVFYDAYSKDRPDFATFFTNHVAGIMHRYWKYAFPEDFNFTLRSTEDFFHMQSLIWAMDIADKQIGCLMRLADRKNGSLIIASSMGQQAVVREYRGEIRLEDKSRLCNAIGFKAAFKDHMAMHPDFNFEFDRSEHRDDFIQRIKRLVNFSGRPIFYAIQVQDLTVNLRLGCPSDVLEKQSVVYQSESGEAQEMSFTTLGLKKIWRDVGTGYHQPKGIFIAYQKNLSVSGARAEIESAHIAPMILKAMGVQPRTIPEREEYSVA